MELNKFTLREPSVGASEAPSLAIVNDLPVTRRYALQRKAY